MRKGLEDPRTSSWADWQWPSHVQSQYVKAGRGGCFFQNARIPAKRYKTYKGRQTWPNQRNKIKLQKPTLMKLRSISCQRKNFN